MKTIAAICIVSIIPYSQSYAGTMGPVNFVQPHKSWTWVGTLSAGPVWENTNKTQTFYLAPNVVKTYAAKHQTHTIFDGEVFMGIQKELPKTLLGQIGLAVAATTNAKASGNIWDDANSSFNNYNYSYKIQHTHVAVKGKILSDQGYWLLPWVSWSLGIGFNNAHGFKNSPLISEAIKISNFAASTQTTFTYALGAGMQKILNSHWQIGAGYEFSDWGKSKLSSASGQTSNSGLTLNHLYTNGVLFNLTYIA